MSRLLWGGSLQWEYAVGFAAMSNLQGFKLKAHTKFGDCVLWVIFVGLLLQSCLAGASIHGG